MRGKLIVGLLLALVVGACPCLAPLAAAESASAHACCPSDESPASGDCCLRAPAASSPAAAHFSGAAILVSGFATDSLRPVPIAAPAFVLGAPPGAPAVRFSGRSPPLLA